MNQRFDQGPSLLLLPKLFHEAFEDLGTTMAAEGIELLKCEPNYTIYFDPAQSKAEGVSPTFTMSTDVAQMKTEIEALEGTDGFHRYLNWMREAHTHFETSVIEVLHKPFSSYVSIFRPTFFKHLIDLHPFVSIWSRAAVYFKSERLRRVFTFGSMYMGMSPYEAPGTYSLLQYTELAEGIWYPKGGFHVVVEKLADVGKRLGVNYRLGTEVDRVLTNGKGEATGIRLKSGEVMDADIVVVNADLVWAYNNLFDKSGSSSTASIMHGSGSTNGAATDVNAKTPPIAQPSPPSPTKYAKSLTKRPTSCSSISFYWSLSSKLPLSTHNIFLAEQYFESFTSIFHDHTLPKEPSFYVNIPSRVDPTAAPEGGDAVVILVPIGHLTSDERDAASYAPDSSIVTKLRDQVLATLKERTGIDIRPMIAHEIINNPLTWEEKFNLDRGAILGLSHNFFNVLSFRPRWNHESLKNVWFVGASTHPGTGVPIVLAGGKMISDEIIHTYYDEGYGPRREGRENGELDYYRTIDVLMLMVAALFVFFLGAWGVGSFVDVDGMLGLKWGEMAALSMLTLLAGKVVEVSGGLKGRVIF